MSAAATAAAAAAAATTTTGHLSAAQHNSFIYADVFQFLAHLMLPSARLYALLLLLRMLPLPLLVLLLLQLLWLLPVPFTLLVSC